MKVVYCVTFIIFSLLLFACTPPRVRKISSSDYDVASQFYWQEQNTALFNSWKNYDAALVSGKNVDEARSDFILALEKERSSQSFRITSDIYGFAEIFDSLFVCVQNDDRLGVTQNFLEYINRCDLITKSSGVTFAILLITISILIIILIGSSLVYKKVIARISEDEKILSATIAAQEEERLRLSLELHDSVAQEMRYVSLLADKLATDDAEKIAAEIKAHQTNCIQDIRTICYNLSSLDIDRGNLVGALQTYCENFMRKSKIKTSLVFSEGVDISFLQKPQMHDIFRIVQELLTNIQKYSEAREVTVLVRNTLKADKLKDGVLIFISDDGNGVFKTPTEGEKHFGMKSINARIKNLSGKISYSSIRDEGTEVTIYIPKI